MTSGETSRLREGDLVLLLSPAKGETYLVRLQSGAVQGSHLGKIPHDAILESGYGEVIRTHLGRPFLVLKPSLGEYTRRIKRKTQIIYPKEAGYLLLHLDVFPGATVVECGSGSGSFTTILATFVGPTGRVVSYERRESFSELARSNCERFGVAERVTFKVRDLDDGEGFDEEGADAVFLDLQNPWEYIAEVKHALAPGRRVGILVPTFNQIQQTLEALEANAFVQVEVVEILLRGYKTNPRRIRPEDLMVGHTGYLLFASSVVCAHPEVLSDPTSKEACDVPSDVAFSSEGAEREGDEEFPAPQE